MFASVADMCAAFAHSGVSSLSVLRTDNPYADYVRTLVTKASDFTQDSSYAGL